MEPLQPSTRFDVRLSRPVAGERTRLSSSSEFQSGVALAVDGYCPGFQVWGSSLDGRRQVAAVGGQATPWSEMLPWTSFPLWCATKPILLQVAATVVEDSGLPISAPLGSILPEAVAAVAGDLSMEDLGSHCYDFSAPSLADVLCSDPQNRGAIALAALGQRTLSELPKHSEWLSWTVLEAVIEFAFSKSSSEVVDTRLEQCGLYGLRHHPPFADALGAWWALDADRPPMPMLGHLLDSELEKLTPSVGAVGSAQALGEWYRALGAASLGLSDTYYGRLFPSVGALNSMRFEFCDKFKDSPFSAGLAAPLKSQNFSTQYADSAIGLAGWLGRVVGFVDLKYQIAGSFVLNGVNLTEPSLIEPVRDQVMDLIYQAVA